MDKYPTQANPEQREHVKKVLTLYREQKINGQQAFNSIDQVMKNIKGYRQAINWTMYR